MQLSRRGVKVRLYEMKPHKFSPAHTSEGFAELVCSNSLKSEKENTAPFILKREMRALSSIVLLCADTCRVPAGGALAVDRHAFSEMMTSLVSAAPNVEIIREEVTDIPEGQVIIASGPLTSDLLTDKIARICGVDSLYFYDAAAPIVDFESIDMSYAFYAGRYDQDADYINCAMSEPEYRAFYQALVEGEVAPLHEFEKHFEACMPIEKLAKRGYQTPLFGPMSPKGLLDKNGKRPFAVVQLRKENMEGSLYNLVGFQTNLRFGEQKRIFSLIPALQHAEFVRYGAMHRNTFIDAPKLLDAQMRLRNEPRIRFAGQISGVEGYVESAASGIYAGLCAALEMTRGVHMEFPPSTAMGALFRYVHSYSGKDYQPMNINFGVMEPLGQSIRNKAARQEAMTARAKQEFTDAAQQYGIELRGELHEQYV